MLLIAQLLIGYFVDHLYFTTHMKSSTAKQGRWQISVDSEAVGGCESSYVMGGLCSEVYYPKDAIVNVLQMCFKCMARHQTANSALV